MVLELIIAILGVIEIALLVYLISKIGAVGEKKDSHDERKQRRSLTKSKYTVVLPFERDETSMCGEWEGTIDPRIAGLERAVMLNRQYEQTLSDDEDDSLDDYVRIL